MWAPDIGHVKTVKWTWKDFPRTRVFKVCTLYNSCNTPVFHVLGSQAIWIIWIKYSECKEPLNSLRQASAFRRAIATRVTHAVSRAPFSGNVPVVV